jgi:Holliday junction DNA helicase RuvA
MISYLFGKIIRKTKQTVVIVVQGVGYEVHLSPLHLVSLHIGNEYAFHTHLQIREDAHELYGFADADTLDFFRILIGVSGVGPKSALNIVSLGSVDDIRNAIGRGDIAFLTQVSGIGKKIAERIVVELKDKLAVAGTSSGSSGNLGDVVEALITMGYSREEGRAALQGLNPADPVETLLKQALKNLSH